MEKENSFILQVLMKESLKISSNKVLVNKLFLTMIFLQVNIKMESQMEKGNMSGKMEHIMKGISCKD